MCRILLYDKYGYRDTKTNNKHNIPPEKPQEPVAKQDNGGRVLPFSGEAT
jgi:hypothetical protein